MHQSLYHGKKPFEGIGEPKRFLAILTLTSRGTCREDAFHLRGD